MAPHAFLNPGVALRLAQRSVARACGPVDGVVVVAAVVRRMVRRLLDIRIVRNERPDVLLQRAGGSRQGRCRRTARNRASRGRASRTRRSSSGGRRDGRPGCSAQSRTLRCTRGLLHAQTPWTLRKKMWTRIGRSGEPFADWAARQRRDQPCRGSGRILGRVVGKERGAERADRPRHDGRTLVRTAIARGPHRLGRAGLSKRSAEALFGREAVVRRRQAGSGARRRRRRLRGQSP